MESIDQRVDLENYREEQQDSNNSSNIDTKQTNDAANVLPENDIYEESQINLSLLDPSRYGWMAIGGIADLSTPHEVCSLYASIRIMCVHYFVPTAVLLLHVR
jgi:hypothetical protein